MLYLASPYSHTDPAVMQRRFDDVRAATAALMARGKIVYSPIVHGHAIAEAHDLPKTHDFWLHHCLGMLKKADELHVLCLDGWKDSIGVAVEMSWWETRRGAVKLLDPAGDLS